MTTTLIYQPGMATPRPREYSRIFLGPLWPTNGSFELADFRGDLLPEQIVRFILPRLSSTKDSRMEIPRLETGLEPFDPAKARAIADSGHEARWHSLFRHAVERASDDEIKQLDKTTIEVYRMARPDNGAEVVPGEAEGSAHYPPDRSEAGGGNGQGAAASTQTRPVWNNRLAMALADKLSSFRLLFSTAQPETMLIELERVRGAIQKATQSGTLDRASLGTTVQRLFVDVQSTIDNRAKAISDEMTKFATSFATIHLAHRYSSGQLDQATLINVADADSLIAASPSSLLLEIVRRSRVVDLVITAPVRDPRAIDALAEEWFGAIPQLQGVIWASPSYRDLDELSMLAANMPPGTSVGQGHVCHVAGKTRHEGVGETVPVLGAVIGRRILLDRSLDASRDQWGVATPLFGPQSAKLLPGLEDADCLRWSDSERKQLSERGFNSLATLDGDIYLFRNRTRSTLPDLLQADAVRFRDYLAGGIRAYLDRVAPGQLSSPMKRRIIADGANSIWKEFTKFPGFDAHLEAGNGDDPTTFTGYIQIPTMIGIEKSVVFFQSASPGQ